MAGTITYAGTTCTALPEETLLDALLRHGVPMRHSCHRGSCHTCLVSLASGEVERIQAPSAIERDGHVLPCVCRPNGPVTLAEPALDKLSVPAELVGRRVLASDVVELDLAPMRDLPYRAGQHVHVIREDGLSRPYSIASLPEEDWFFRIHVRVIPNGRASTWLAEAPIGTKLAVRGPSGESYDPATRDRPLLLLATGTGVGALAAVARAALAAGHAAPITLYHGGRRPEDLYLDAPLRAAAAADPRFTYVGCASRAGGGRVTAAFDAFPDLSEHVVFLCGSPAMVEDARARALLAGAARDRIVADPFDPATPPLPRDAEKIAAIAPDPEMWAALEGGPRLLRILLDFYGRVFVDPLLSPFFRGMSPEYVATKQYTFLADRFTGGHDYFGLNPYNAHHWMVISDALFDYRERLFERVLRDDAFPEPLIRRWMALHEAFRTDIVKDRARGLVIDGVEVPVHDQTVEPITLDTICDRCGGEIRAGSVVRYLHRLGVLHCAACAGLTHADARPH